jgi:hypothetical protein
VLGSPRGKKANPLGRMEKSWEKRPETAIRDNSGIRIRTSFRLIGTSFFVCYT